MAQCLNLRCELGVCHLVVSNLNYTKKDPFSERSFDDMKKQNLFHFSYSVVRLFFVLFNVNAT